MLQYVSLNSFFHGVEFVWKSVWQNSCHELGKGEEPVEAIFFPDV